MTSWDWEYWQCFHPVKSLSLSRPDLDWAGAELVSSQSTEIAPDNNECWPLLVPGPHQGSHSKVAEYRLQVCCEYEETIIWQTGPVSLYQSRILQRCKEKNSGKNYKLRQETWVRDIKFHTSFNALNGLIWPEMQSNFFVVFDHTHLLQLFISPPLF